MKTHLPHLISLLFIVFFYNISFSQTAPVGPSPQQFCSLEDLTLADLLVEGTDIIFWDAPLGNQLPIGTPLENGTTYYVTQGTATTAEILEILVYSDTIPAPTAPSEVYIFCGERTIDDIPVFNTDGFDNIIWFDQDSTSGNPLPPNTTLVNETIYYAFQGIGDCAESLAITIEIHEQIPAPTGESEQYFCLQDQYTLADLDIINTAGFDGIFWFDQDSTLGNPLPPNTPIVNETTYYAFQGIGDCAEGLAVTIHILSSDPMPEGDHNQYFCNDVDTILSDIYTDVIWFLFNDSSGDPLDPNTIVMDNVTYYAFTEIGLCAEGFDITVHLIDCSASVDDDEFSIFTLFPNPVKDILNIKINNNQTDINFTISDIQGRKIISNTLTIVDNTVKIDISDLDANVYFISLTDKRHTSTKKFVKK